MTPIPFVSTGAYPVRAGNRVRRLIDGEAAFRRICDAIDQAEARVWVAATFPWPDFRMPDGRGSFFEVLAPADPDGELFRDERRTLARTPHFTLAGLAGRDAGGARRPVHVHAKLMIIDDVWATVGSCNLHRYSMYGNSELNVAFADAVTVRALRCQLLAEHLEPDTSALDGRSALAMFRSVAERNAGRRSGDDPDWEGIACALDPLQSWPG